MRFSRLRVSGFKSFVDPTELLIERGLTGVVGPNGCGKSNLLEAIRWVMGENRVKSMRGTDMDDVIFAGTDKRPARNFSEVTLVIDNFDRSAPVEHNDADFIEVTRRIERQSGSAYRINGKDVRQKDVQLLFADAATGAHSPALVSQGRVGGLINAKPQDRRQILEEAAGISGLHSRRRDAESRLRGAESNLLRVQDVVLGMEAQISGLKRQAKQAIRYRLISGEIRQAEASLLFLKWKQASEEVLNLERGLREAETVAADVTKHLAVLSSEQMVAAATLPPLRNADVEAAARLQRLAIERENLEAEAERRRQSALTLRSLLEQIIGDREREQEINEDAHAALERLNAEKERLEAAQNLDQSAEIEARDVLSAASTAANSAEGDFDQLSETSAQARARRSSMESDRLAIARRAEQLASEQNRLTSELAVMTAGDDILVALKTAEENVTNAEAAAAKSADSMATSEAATAAARTARSEADSERAQVQGQSRALEGAVTSLRALLVEEDGDDAPVANGLKAEAGFETAAGAAFGDDIDAGLDADASRFWQMFEILPGQGWPGGITPLGDFVSVPKVLERRLAYMGFASDLTTGTNAATELLPGQCIVDQAGNFWRWDGFVQKAGAPSQAAIRLEQKNRLLRLEADFEALQTHAALADDKSSAATAAHEVCREAEQSQRALRQDIERNLAECRRALVAAEQAASQRASRVGSLQESLARITDESQEATARKAAIDTNIAALPQNEILEAAVAEARGKVEALRSELSSARGAYETLRRETDIRRDRLLAIAAESGSWSLRVAGTEKQLASLDAREISAKKQLAAAEASPEDLQQRKHALMDQLDIAEKARMETSDRLVAAEQLLADKDKALKEIQEQTATVRERQIRAEAALENAVSRRADIHAQIDERFECAPTQLLEKVELDTSDSLPEPTALEIKLEQLKRERDRMGAVNLRADEELAEISEQLDHLVKERIDLESAIGRLRHAIGNLNREGRERLLIAFDIVNKHFGELFKSLFGGGEAHLKLTESDDPLEAGLEIFASPPGKRLQVLSLLSGGEQALTALSLIFAVFITNPAPICILDEVDAPLDDANVERFCNLLDDMTSRTDTRFLIVTHNAVSMARMNRLFGVTMAERGISTLVSVDLERASELQEAG